MTEQFYDKKGVPIYPGDLLKTLHFIGARRKKYYLYHTVVRGGDYLYMVPTSHLETGLARSGGKCLLKYGIREGSEVIAGYGPPPHFMYDERPRKKS